MNFGEAIAALKVGKTVARSGWNGKGMHLYLESFVGHNLEYQPAIVMLTADKKLQPGWLASQADMLAEDWWVLA